MSNKTHLNPQHISNPNPNESTQKFFEHKDAPPIAPSPTTELEASRLAENVANTENAAERKEALENSGAIERERNAEAKGLPRVSPDVALPADPRAVPGQQPVVHGGPGVKHIPGTDIVVGGPTQQ